MGLLRRAVEMIALSRSHKARRYIETYLAGRGPERRTIVGRSGDAAQSSRRPVS